MGDWIGAALLGLVGSSGDDSDGSVTAAHDRDGSTTTQADAETSTGGIEASGTDTADTGIEAAPAIDDEPVFTAREEE